MSANRGRRPRDLFRWPLEFRRRYISDLLWFAMAFFAAGVGAVDAAPSAAFGAVAAGALFATSAILLVLYLRRRRVRGSAAAEVNISRGCDLMDEGRFAEAAALFQRAVDGGERWAALNLGNALCALGRWEEAAAAYEVAVAAGELSARLNLAHVLAQPLLRPAEARRHYEQAWREGDPAAAVYLAYAARDAGDDDEALRWMHLAVDRRVPDARWRLGELLGLLGRTEEGLAILTDEARGGDGHARIAYALLLRPLGRLDEADAVLRQAVADGAGGAAVYVAELAAGRGDPAEARRWYERAAAHDPAALFDYALFLEDAADDPLEVVRAWERVIAAGDRRGHLNLAAWWVRLDRLDDARHAYARARGAGDEKARDDFSAWVTRLRAGHG